MKTSDIQQLDSFAREAMRQAHYYRLRNPKLWSAWDGFYKEAMCALQNQGALRLEAVQENPNPIIKAWEQVEELHNPLED